MSNDLIDLERRMLDLYRIAAIREHDSCLDLIKTVEQMPVSERLLLPLPAHQIRFIFEAIARTKMVTANVYVHALSELNSREQQVRAELHGDQNSPVIDDRSWRRQLIGQAMQAIISSPHIDDIHFNEIASDALGLADAIIAAENRNGD